MKYAHGLEGYRQARGIPFEKAEIDPEALTAAADRYSDEAGDCDEVALGKAILLYLEVAEAA